MKVSWTDLFLHGVTLVLLHGAALLLIHCVTLLKGELLVQSISGKNPVRLTCSFTVLHSCLYSVLQAGAEAAPYPEEAELPRPLLYWLCALLAILWLRPKLRRRPAYWDSREKGFASAPRRHNEAQTSCNYKGVTITPLQPAPITHRIGDLHVGAAGVAVTPAGFRLVEEQCEQAIYRQEQQQQKGRRRQWARWHSSAPAAAAQCSSRREEKRQAGGCRGAGAFSSGGSSRPRRREAQREAASGHERRNSSGQCVRGSAGPLLLLTRGRRLMRKKL